MGFEIKYAIMPHSGYYPYGLPIMGGGNTQYTPYLFGNKVFEDRQGLNIYDFGARNLAANAWTTPDPLSPYSYCGGDPINRVDKDGRDWYRTTMINFDPTIDAFEFQEVILYTSASSEEQFIEQNNDPRAQYLGNIVVVFDGSYDERLAADGTIDGEGAINAAVTVYGPRGENDVDTYIGFTMTSDFSVFGAIDNGEYDVAYDARGKSGNLKSHYAVNGRKPVNCLNGINPSPEEYKPYSSTQKDGIFVHSTNYNGYAGHNKAKKQAVSTGCPLIHGAQWNRFKNQIGNSGFKMLINRK